MKRDMGRHQRAPETDNILLPKGQAEPADPVSPFASRVNRFLEVMNSVGDDAQRYYQEALENLRANPEETIIAITQAEARCSRDDYNLRWALVYAATQIQHDSALPFFSNILFTPIPRERSALPHSYSTVGQETILRTTVIEGVGGLAAAGNERAVQVLLESLSIESISIRRASIQALFKVSSDLRERIAEYLPSNQHYLLDIQPMHVSEVQQVESPERHLREDARLDKPTPPDVSDHPDRSSPSGDAPRLRG
jgi:hypothetical protein